MVDELVVVGVDVVELVVVDEGVLEVLELVVVVGVDVVELVVVDEGVFDVLELTVVDERVRDVLELVVEVLELVVVVAGVDADDSVVVPVAVVTTCGFDAVPVPHPTASI